MASLKRPADLGQETVVALSMVVCQVENQPCGPGMMELADVSTFGAVTEEPEELAEGHEDLFRRQSQRPARKLNAPRMGGTGCVTLGAVD